MRIAFSGSHRVGKSTLIQRLAEQLPSYEVVDEPYHLLLDNGYEFEDPPSPGDFVVQLERSIEDPALPSVDVLFDRCPAAFLAYLLVGGRDVTALVEPATEAMESLDLVVLVPIEQPDAVVLPAFKDPQWRRDVDAQLGELLLGSDLARDVLVVEGDVAARAAQVVAFLSRQS